MERDTPLLMAMIVMLIAFHSVNIGLADAWTYAMITMSVIWFFFWLLRTR